MTLKFTSKIKLLLVSLIAIFFSFTYSHADEITFAVAPSKIVDLILEPGDSKVIEFNIGNQSKFPSNEKSKFNLYEFGVHIQPSLLDSDMNPIASKGILNVDTPSVKIKPNQSKPIKLKISIPKDFEKNEYIIHLSFTRTPLKSVETSGSTNAVSSIKVPIYIGVGNPSEYSKLKTDFNVDKFDIDFGERNSIFHYVTQNLKSLFTINPVKVYSVFENIKENNIYVVNKDGNTKIDLPRNNTVYLKDVVSQSKKLSDTHYFYVPKELLNITIANILFEEEKVVFSLKNNKQVILNCNNTIRDDLRTQINSLLPSLDGNNPTINYFLETLKVPKNKNFSPHDYNLLIKLANSGQKTTHVSAIVNLVKDNTSNIESNKVDILTINKGDLSSIKIPLKSVSSWTDGRYSLYGDFIDTKKVHKKSSYNFDVDSSIRSTIFNLTLTIYTSILLILLLTSICIFTIIKKRKPCTGYIIYTGSEFNDVDINTHTILDNNKDLSLSDIKITDILDLSIRKKPSRNSKVINTLPKGTLIKVLDISESENIKWGHIEIIKTK